MADISGTITFEDGTPLADAMLVLSGHAEGIAYTDSEGNYTFENIGEGPFDNLTITPSYPMDICTHPNINLMDEILIQNFNIFGDPGPISPYGLIAADVNGDYLCMHGGISPELETVEDINKINRFVEPPLQGFLCDLLWSDPC